MDWKERVKHGLGNRENALFAALILLHLIPVWAFKYFPSQDGPPHIENSVVVREYNEPDRSVFREYYVLNRNFDPNWFGHLVMAGLMTFVPILVAEKLLLSGYLVLLPLSVRYAVRAIQPESGFLATLSFPFLYNYLFHMGFYNFVWSLPLFFFVVGFWMKHHERFDLRATVLLTFLGLLLYFCHLVSLVTAWMFIGVLVPCFTLSDLIRQLQKRTFNLRASWDILRNRALVPLYAFLPTLILTGLFLLQKGTDHGAPGGNLWNRLRRLESLISYNEAEGYYSTALVYLFTATVLYLLAMKAWKRKGNRWDGILLVVALYVAVYFTAPDGMSGGGFISHRMNLYPFFGLILWFAAQSFHRVVKWAVQGVAVGIALILLGMHTTKYAELNDYLKEYLSCMEFVEPNSTLLPLCFSHQGHAPDGRVLSSRIGLFLHASGHIAAQKRVVEFDNYEGNTGYFPVIFRWELNPFAHIARNEGIEFQPPGVDFLTYPERTKGRVDYVLLWRVRDELRDHAYTQSIFEQLGKGYELIYTSPQRGFVQLYKRRKQ